MNNLSTSWTADYGVALWTSIKAAIQAALREEVLAMSFHCWLDAFFYFLPKFRLSGFYDRFMSIYRRIRI
jgi:hypothetical protein